MNDVMQFHPFDRIVIGNREWEVQETWYGVRGQQNVVWVKDLQKEPSPCGGGQCWVPEELLATLVARGNALLYRLVHPDDA